MEISFNEAESEKVKETVELYRFTKEIMLYNEQIDPGSNSFPQVINELRNAYDHFNRALAVKIGLEGEKGSDYIVNTIDKALGHVYRAAYDCLDWLNINISEEIKKELQPYSQETIKAVIPDYYSEIRPILSKYEHKVVELKSIKDINSIDSGGLEEFAKIVKFLGDTKERIIYCKDALIEHENKSKREKWKNRGIGAVITLILSIIAGITIWTIKGC